MPDPKKVVVKRQKGDPYFRDEKSFDKYYAKKAFSILSKKGLTKRMADDNTANMEVNVATGAEIPNYKTWKQEEDKEKAGKEKRSKMPEGDVSGKSKTGGYRYDSGKGKPAKGSLTNRLKKKKPY